MEPMQNDEWQPAIRPNSSTTSRADDSIFSKQIPHDAGMEWAEERTRVAVGRNINVSGKLVFDGPARIEGYFRGEVRSVDLVVITEHGTVEGRIQAPRLLLMGELRGDIAGCERVVIGPRAKVFGNIETKNLTIREGAYVDGQIRMSGITATT
jgi:cytoskeletal protein CcmA (bactofilin family)